MTITEQIERLCDHGADLFYTMNEPEWEGYEPYWKNGEMFFSWEDCMRLAAQDLGYSQKDADLVMLLSENFELCNW